MVPIYICKVMHMAPSVVLGLVPVPVIHSDRIVLKDSVSSGDSKDSNSAIHAASTILSFSSFL